MQNEDSHDANPDDFPQGKSGTVPTSSTTFLKESQTSQNQKTLIEIEDTATKRPMTDAVTGGRRRRPESRKQVSNTRKGAVNEVAKRYRRRIKNKGRDMFIKIAVGTHKGGTGKTTTVFNLSAAYATMGFKVLCVDCDAQGDLSWAFRKDHKELDLTLANLFTEDGCYTEDLICDTEFENISIICADRRLDQVQQTSGFSDNPLVAELAHALEDVRDDYDVVLFDCPPGAHLSLYAAMVAADVIIAPLEPSILSIKSIASLRADIAEIHEHWNPDIQFRYFLSRAGRNKASEDAYVALVDAVGQEHVVRSRMPNLTTFNNSITTGKPVSIKSPKSKPAGYVYELATEILEGADDGKETKQAA